MKREIEIKKKLNVRGSEKLFWYFFWQLFVKFYLLRFYEQVQPDANPRGQLSGVSG